VPALLALTVAVLPNLPGFLATVEWLPPDRVAPIFISIYHYAWFVGFFVAFAVYLAAKKLSAPAVATDAPKAAELTRN
jgi:NCS1 family nucleobase:cation symporter-1